MSFKNNYATYSNSCFEESSLLFPLKVPFMNSVDKSIKENFNNKVKKTNDFPMAWTCSQREDKSWFCPLRGDTY